MESKKINQLATEVSPAGTDLTIIGDPITGVSKKITLIQLATTIGAAADLQQVTNNGATTTNPIEIGGLTITGLATGVLKSDSGVVSSVPYGAANGVATLGGDGKVPSSQLPSYVDDVIEVANYASLPVTGETGVLYITLDTNKIYRWTGSTYVEIADSSAVWGAITGTLSNQTDLQTALDNKVPYTGATANVNLGTYDLTADVITGATGSFASSGGSDTFAINHSSGSGIALNITKAGNGEGLYVNKTSGSGNAATIVGTLNATTLVKNGGTSSEFLKADGSVDTNTYVTTNTTQTITGDKTYSGVNIYNDYQTRFSMGIAINNTTSGGAVGSHTVIGANVNGLQINLAGGGYNNLNFASTSAGNTYTLPNATGTIALTSDLSAYLPLSGGTLTGALNINTGSGTGLNVASDSVIFRSNTGVGSPRQMVFSIGGGSSTFLDAKGYGANYITDFGIRTYNASGTAFDVFFGTSAGDVGIGTTAPLSKLQVVDTGTIMTLGEASGTTGKQLLFGIDGSTGTSEIQSVWQGTGYTILALNPAGGNVGIGTSSPSDTIGYGIALDVQSSSGAALYLRDSSNPTTQYGFIAYDGNDDGLKIQNQNSSGYIRLNTNGTERMRITSNGNVAIGGTAPSAKLSVYKSQSGTSAADSGVLRLENTGANYTSTLVITDGTTNDGLISYLGATQSLGFGVGSTANQMVITSSGNVGIGTISPTQGKLVVSNAGPSIIALRETSVGVNSYWNASDGSATFFGNDSNHPLAFVTNGSERMRISSSGDLIVGGTTAPQSASGRGCVTINGSSNAILTFAVGNTEKGYVYHNASDINLINSVNGGNLYCISYNNGVYLSSGATSWTANSDERLKDINGNIENAVQKLNTLRAVNFSWKNDETKKEVLGLIAQDVEKVFPQVIDKNKLPSKVDEVQADETEYLGVRYQELVPVLIAAIQELKAEIDALKNK